MRARRRDALAARLRGRAGELRWLAGMAFLALLLWDTAGALAAVRDALRTWAESVAPSLFPFLAVLPLLTSPEAREIYAWALRRPLEALFALPGRAAAALAVGLIAGSPAGALACAAAADGMARGDFKRLALLACGMSPVYLISGAGVALLDSRRAGLLLAGSQLAAQLLTGLALRAAFRGEAEALRAPAGTAAERPVRAAVFNTLQIAGYMAFFAVLARFAGRLLGARAGLIAQMLLDVPGGAARAADLPLPLEARLCLIAALAGFGGLCIGAQNMAVLGPLGLKWREYLAAKAAQAALCAGFCAAGLRLLAAERVFSLASLALPAPELAALAMLGLLVPALLSFLPGGKERRIGKLQRPQRRLRNRESQGEV